MIHFRIHYYTHISKPCVTKLKTICLTSDEQLKKRFKKWHSILTESDVYVPIEMRTYVTCTKVWEFRWLLSKVEGKRISIYFKRLWYLSLQYSLQRTAWSGTLPCGNKVNMILMQPLSNENWFLLFTTKKKGFIPGTLEGK